MNNSFQKITLGTGLGLLLLTSGCFDTTDEFTINPDGSGKVVHECTFDAVDLGNQTQDDGLRLTNAVSQVLEQSKGVDVWREVTFKSTDDGQMYFRGTAYFKDLSKLDIPNQTMLEFDWSKLADGNRELMVRTNKSTNPAGMTRQQSAPVKNPSPEELAKRIKQERGQFRRSKPMLEGIIGAMKDKAILHLPGKVASSSNFATDAAGNLTIQFDGARLLDVMEKLVNDDDWCRRHAGTGFDEVQEKPLAEAEVNGMMFGEKAPIRATVAAGTTPLFDYAAETAAGRAGYEKLRNSLKASNSSPGESLPEDTAPVAAAMNAGLKSVQVASVQMQQHNLPGFGNPTNYSISLLLEFPGAIQTVSESTLETAVADDNSSLMPDSEWERKGFSQLANDKTAAIVRYKLQFPGSNVKGIKEISGRVKYQVSSGTKAVDLGLNELKAGATGTNLDARIESIGDGWQKNGSQMMALRLNADPGSLKSLSLVVDGNPVELQQRGYSGGMNSYSFNYESKQAFPPNGRLVAEVYDKTQKFEAPFKLENLTLLGTTMETTK